MEKIVRTLCFFTKESNRIPLELSERLSALLTKNGYSIQTERICFPDFKSCDESALNKDDVMTGVGTLSFEQAHGFLPCFLQSEKTLFNIDLSDEEISDRHVDILFKIMSKKAGHTFNFAYCFQVPPSSPYFPSASFGREGFSVGLQPTNLAKGCTTLSEWLENMRSVWLELHSLLSPFSEFLGIDSSIAPLFLGEGSLISFVKQLYTDFSTSVTTDFYTSLSSFVRDSNPCPVGLCGVMLPCLEDFELAKEYERGNFSIERNIFLSLHSGLGIDTYPIAIDQPKKKVVEILRLVQSLSRKYSKPLSVRFVSDGKAKIGDRTEFNNQYLCDVRVRTL